MQVFFASRPVAEHLSGKDQIRQRPIGPRQVAGDLFERRAGPIPLTAHHQEQRQPLPCFPRGGICLHERFVDGHRLGPPLQLLKCHPHLQPGLEIIGPQPDRALATGQCSSRVIEAQQGGGEIAVGLRVIGVDFERPPQGRGCPGMIPLPHKRGPQIIVGNRVARLEPKRFAIAGDRPRYILLHLQRPPQIEVRAGRGGPGHHRRAELPHRSRHISCLQLDQAEAIEGRHQRGIALESRTEGSRGFRRSAQAPQGLTSSMQKPGLGRRDLKRRTKLHQCLFSPLCSQSNSPQQKQSLGMPRFALDHLPAEARRHVESSRGECLCRLRVGVGGRGWRHAWGSEKRGRLAGCGYSIRRWMREKRPWVAFSTDSQGVYRMPGLRPPGMCRRWRWRFQCWCHCQ